MARLNQASAVRIALVIVLGLVVLEYVWLETQPGRRTGGRDGLFSEMTAGCPAPSDTESHGEADYEWRITALDGREVAFEEFRNQVVFVNVWATWCGPCREEMPAIQSLFDVMGQKGVAFVVVSEEKLDVVKRYIEKEKYTFPVFVADSVPDVFESRGIPATFVVNRAGQVVLERIGSRNWNAHSCHEFLQSLL